MADDLFIREYRLTIGTPEKIVQRTEEVKAGERFTASSLFPNTILPEKIPEDFREITDLHIDATIYASKNSSASKNTASTIKIYNLSEKTVEFIKEDQIIILEAGYSGRDLPIIFSGQVARVSTMKKGKDRITEITCGEAYRAKRDIRWSNYWPKDTPALTVLNDMFDVLRDSGVSVGTVLQPSQPVASGGSDFKFRIDEYSFSTGFTIDGNLIMSLEDYCKYINYRAYFVRETLYVEPINFPELREFVSIEQDNIKGNVEPVKSSTNKQGNSLTEVGVKVNLFLDGKMALNKRVDINFGPNEGSYEIKSMVHKLQLEGADWDTQLELKRLQ